MADTDPKAEVTTGGRDTAAIDKARKDEAAKQKAVVDAVFKATHYAKGNPIPIVPPEA
jgi:hypothetical protein